MVSPIKIPDNAPFSPEQRQWLSEFLGTMLASASGGAAPQAGPSVPVTVLFASQTGTAEGLAKKLVKTLKKGNFEPSLNDMATYDRERLPKEENLLIITSTYGDGEPPDTALELHTWLMADGAPSLEGVSYSVLSLGDSSYPDFCQCGTEFDTRLAELGAKRIYDRVDVDVDPDEPYAVWSKAVIALLSPAAGAVVTSGAADEEEHEETGFSKKKPFPSSVLKNHNLNGPGPKETHHIEISLEGSELSYEVGDALGLYPENPEDVVDEIIAGLPFKAGEVPTSTGEEVSLREALIRHYDIGNINKSLIEKWQKRSGSPYLRSLVEADDRKQWDDFCWGRDLIDLVLNYPADFTDGEEFVSVLKKLQPRLYSIASSPKAHPGEVHLCVGIVRYDSHGRKRGGICSTYLSDRLKDDTKPGVYLHHNLAFRLPADGNVPVIMVGPGTGIAPFRAFLEERKVTESKGANWLFFGNPHSATDYLYKDELEGFVADGTLGRLDLAWSRDQKEKVYVQNLMVKEGAEIWKWFQEGAAFYVCGDASRMAKDVDAALLTIAKEHGKLSDDDAAAYIAQLKKDKRYLRDVY
ncbi:MAG: sulfite reductase subunit alpha [Akkermansiaceae bacterium]|jgi:sulfite reductase (NADPH) flavoprotein alpha-component|nr:sulfite reductase subunit alpha [Akkermansiaceae bacterium]MDP4646135.1 sulfite reductase subunit alpha [Akkermansiaceae bacterium]MDP4720934.1 sulfite reductase subunit alpha [Akkermansiaceae bacterium]MDP4780707.1 sulfite reductase subunit alpha [Akkermansiaceae bacterium]MDP4845653.1 sulfite reductase subunit alpha [Akkermansiaceae bacterium]